MTHVALVKDFSTCIHILVLILCVVVRVSAVWIEMIRLMTCSSILTTHYYMMNCRDSKISTKTA